MAPPDGFATSSLHAAHDGHDWFIAINCRPLGIARSFPARCVTCGRSHERFSFKDLWPNCRSDHLRGVLSRGALRDRADARRPTPHTLLTTTDHCGRPEEALGGQSLFSDHFDRRGTRPLRRPLYAQRPSDPTLRGLPVEKILDWHQTGGCTAQAPPPCSTAPFPDRTP